MNLVLYFFTRLKRLICWFIALALAVVLLTITLTVIAHSSLNETTVWLNGPADPVDIGKEFKVTIQISNVVDLFGGDFRISFDSDRLSVLDSIPDFQNSGVQILPLDCPAPNFVAANAADNMAGTIIYAATQITPTLPVNGDCAVAEIRFLAKDIGETTIHIDEVTLANSDAEVIPAELEDLTVQINPVIVANFHGTPMFGRAPLNVQFIDQSIGSPKNWMWEFGDGFTSTLQYPSHTYFDPGLFSITLTVSSGAFSDRAIKLDYIDVRYGSYLPVIINES